MQLWTSILGRAEGRLDAGDRQRRLSRREAHDVEEKSAN